MKKKVVAALACRVQSQRLYAKPLQFLDIENKLTILEYLVDFLKSFKLIDGIVLAISDGDENAPFFQLARKMDVPYITGSQDDVQSRLIKAAKKGRADIIYRITTECPFVYMDNFSEVLKMHIANKAAITVIEGLPEGTYYELITVKDLMSAHRDGEKRHRSELCTLYISEHPEKYFIQKLAIKDPSLKRPDIRLSVDYPEDLIVVREVYKALKRKYKFVPIPDIIRYLDRHPELKKINGWIDAGIGRIWN